MKTKYFLLFIPVGIVYILGLVTDIMEVDASQYAGMSKEMLDSGNYLQLHDRGEDYLDKPPLLFWVSALSFRLLGVSNFTYKLPSVLFSILGLLATFQLGKRLYGERAGFYSALLLASCQAWFLMNHDIRTDTILAACTIFAIWQLFLFINDQKWVTLFWGSVGVAGAMLTKGPIGIMVPALALGSYLLVKRDWKNLFNWKWLLLPLIVLLFISPFLYGLYQQFDLHPGKIIQGVPTSSGVRFYLWTQSFGRITGESIWRDDTTQLFFTHTFLWAFLPWCILYLVALWKDTVSLFKSKFKLDNAALALTWGGFVFPFIAFSLSNYKLPHYIFVIFPLAAISTGHYVELLFENLSQKTQSIFKWIQAFVVFVIYALGILLCTWAFPLSNPFYWLVVVLAIGLTIYFIIRGNSGFERILLPSFIAILTFNFLLNIHFYPSLFQYTSTNQAAKIVFAAKGEKNFKAFQGVSHGLDVYSHRTVPNFNSLNELLASSTESTLWIFTTEEGHKMILASPLTIIEDKKLEHFHISTLSGTFLNPATRPKELTHNYLLKIDMRK